MDCVIPLTIDAWFVSTCVGHHALLDIVFVTQTMYLIDPPSAPHHRPQEPLPFSVRLFLVLTFD